MAAPSKNWNTITDSQVSGDRLLDTVLMTALRDNLVHIEEWVGNGYTAAQDHDHDGVNSKAVVIPDNSIAGGKMRTTAPTGGNVGSQAVGAGTSYSLSSGVYALMGPSFLVFEIYSTATSSWQTSSVGLNGGIFFADGSNMRVKNTDASSQTFQWWKF
jgi:hypothetical protein